MRAAQVRLYPLPLGSDGVWFTIPDAAEHYGVTTRMVQRWAAEDPPRVRSTRRPKGMGKGLLVWSADVGRAVAECRVSQSA